MFWNYNLQIPKSLNKDRRSFRTTFTGAGVSRWVALSYWKRCFCYFCKYCKTLVFDFVVAVLQAAVFREQARSRFPTSYFQPGNQGLECAQNTESLAWVSSWMKDTGEFLRVVTCRPASYDHLEISTLWWPEDLLCGDLNTYALRQLGEHYSAATWRPTPWGDLETSTLRRSGDPHPEATWRPTTFGDLKTSTMRRCGNCP